MKQGDYLKLYRSLLNWEWYTEPNTFRVYIHCLLKANWAAGKYQGIDVPAGSFVTSFGHLADELGLSVRSVRTALQHLENTKNLTRKSTSRYQIITIENWESFQTYTVKSDKVADIQPTNNRQAIDKQPTTIEEETKNNKNKKNNKNYRERVKPFTPPSIEEVKAYCEERNNSVDAERFVDFYSTKGWMVGKNRMRDWKAAVRTWESREQPKKDTWEYY